MNRRSTRYHVIIVRNDNSSEMIQCNARRKDAIRRATFVAQDTIGWPSVKHCYVLDVMTWNDVVPFSAERKCDALANQTAR
jgi:hypothetical protein